MLNLNIKDINKGIRLEIRYSQNFSRLIAKDKCTKKIETDLHTLLKISEIFD